MREYLVQGPLNLTRSSVRRVVKPLTYGTSKV
jgi:hypothetical protein